MNMTNYEKIKLYATKKAELTAKAKEVEEDG